MGLSFLYFLHPCDRVAHAILPRSWSATINRFWNQSALDGSSSCSVNASFTVCKSSAVSSCHACDSMSVASCDSSPPQPMLGYDGGGCAKWFVSGQASTSDRATADRGGKCTRQGRGGRNPHSGWDVFHQVFMPSFFHPMA